MLTSRVCDTNTGYFNKKSGHFPAVEAQQDIFDDDMETFIQIYSNWSGCQAWDVVTFHSRVCSNKIEHLWRDIRTK